MFIKPVELTPRLEDIQEAAKDIGQEDIVEAASIPRERAKYRRRMARAQLHGRPPSPLAGTGVQSTEEQGPMWKVLWGEGDGKQRERIIERSGLLAKW